MKVVEVPTPDILDLLKDRKDRSTKKAWDEFQALLAEIRVNGIRNPLKVVREGGKYRVICGQTRLLCARTLLLAVVPAIVLEGEMTATRLLIEELTDNNMTVSFDLLALAGIFTELMQENKWTPAELCRNVPAAKPALVSKALSIFEGLLPDLKDKLRSGEIGPRIAYALSRLPQDKQAAALDQVKLMKVEAAEVHIASLLGKKPKKAKPVKFRTSHGLTILCPGEANHDTAAGDLSTLADLIRRALKLGIPMCSAPQLKVTG